MKDTILLFTNLKEPIDELSDEEAGQLFKAILAYQNGEEPKLKGLLKVIFLQIRQQIDYNNQKYSETSRKRSEARKTWLEKKKQNSTNDNKPQQNLTNDNKPHLYDNDNGNGIENENGNEIENGNDNEIENGNIINDIQSGSVNNTRANAAAGNAELRSSQKAYGIFHNVFLSDDEMAELARLYPRDYEEMIENMSNKINNNNYHIRNHYNTMLKWKREDDEEQKAISTSRKKSKPEPEPIYTYDFPEFVAKMED